MIATAPARAWKAVTATHSPTERTLDRALREHDLTFREWAALDALSTGPLLMMNLADAIALTRPAASRMADRLESRGLAVRSTQDNARMVALAVTPAGRTLADAARPTIDATLDAARPQLAQLAEHLRDLLPQLDGEHANTRTHTGAGSEPCVHGFTGDDDGGAA